MKIHLVRDCLDKQAVDRNGLKMGRIDGVLIDPTGPGRPRVRELHIGATVLARRLPRWTSAWLSRIIEKFCGSNTAVTSADWSKVKLTRNEVHLDIDSEKTPARALEHWLRDRVIKRIPGA